MFNVQKALYLYAITDRRWLHKDSELANAVEQAILGGVTMVQFREKPPYPDNLKDLACMVQKVCKTYGVPFIVNDLPELAQEINADGVHVGQEDASCIKARSIVGDSKVVGVSATTFEEACKAQADGADYLGVGDIFGTPSKPDAKPVSLNELTRICTHVSIPVVAIGGITTKNVAQLSETGIDGISVISGIFGAKNIKKAAQTFDTKLSNFINPC